MTPEERAAHIRALVDAAPPLTPDQRDKLWVLLAPMRRKLNDNPENVVGE